MNSRFFVAPKYAIVSAQDSFWTIDRERLEFADKNKTGIRHLKKRIFFLLVAVLTGLPVGAGNPFPEARKLVNSQGCKACHLLDNEGGNYAKPLEKTGHNMNREQIRHLLLNGIGKRGSDRYMPSYSHLRESEIEGLIEYLESYK